MYSQRRCPSWIPWALQRYFTHKRVVWHLVKSCCVYFQNHYFAFFLLFHISVEKTHCPSQLQCFIFLQLTYRNLHFFKKSTITDLHVKPLNQIHPSFWNNFWIQIELAKIIGPLRLDLVFPKVAVCLMEFTPKGKGNMTIWNYHLLILLEYPPQSWSVRTERATLGWTMMETKTRFKMIEQNRTTLEPNPIFLSLVGVDLPKCKYRKKWRRMILRSGACNCHLAHWDRTLSGTFNILCDYSFNFVFGDTHLPNKSQTMF